MAKIEMYTTPFCGYCARAKSLLEKKGAAYEEMDVMMDEKKRTEMRERARRSTVPQIFINGQYGGGSDEPAALEPAGPSCCPPPQPGWGRLPPPRHAPTAS